MKKYIFKANYNAPVCWDHAGLECTKKGELLKILGKYKVIGDTTYGLGWKEAKELANEIVALWTKKEIGII